MELGSARELKIELLEGLSRTTRAASAGGAEQSTVAVGVVPRRRDFGVAVRVSSAGSLRLPGMRDVLARWDDDTDVRVIGPVHALTQANRPPGAPGSPRQLRPGASVAHVAVTAGTLGGFVRDADGRVLILSNNHVLADTDRASLGDAVLSPGPADGGRPDVDRVATLSFFRRFSTAGNLLDLALAVVDDPERVGGNSVPEGELSSAVAQVLDGIAVGKVGRTTGHTTGTVTAVELDGVTVDYGRGDAFTFDDCLEVEGDTGPFSAGGDSGSLVYERSGAAVLGLLFAGSTTGGAGGTGLTFCNPAALALEAAGVTLL